MLGFVAMRLGLCILQILDMICDFGALIHFGGFGPSKVYSNLVERWEWKRLCSLTTFARNISCY